MAAPRRIILRTMDGMTVREDMALDIVALGTNDREVGVGATAGEAAAVVMRALLLSWWCWVCREHRRFWACARAGTETTAE